MTVVVSVHTVVVVSVHTVVVVNGDVILSSISTISS